MGGVKEVRQLCTHSSLGLPTPMICEDMVAHFVIRTLQLSIVYCRRRAIFGSKEFVYNQRAENCTQQTAKEAI